jgi:microcystin-dependent protein
MAANPAVTNIFQPNTIAESGEVNQNFTDLIAWISANAMQRDGSTSFTNIPTLPATNPTNANHAVRKAYVDQIVIDAAGVVFPSGMMVDYVGDSAPTGWALMNGQTLTNAESVYPSLWAAAPIAWRSGSNLVLPDMATRSTVGRGSAGAFSTLGAVGGNADAAVIQHTHGLSGNAALSGNLPLSGTPSISGSSTISGTTGGGGEHNHGGSVGSGGSHSHSASSSVAGGHNHGGFNWARNASSTLHLMPGGSNPFIGSNLSTDGSHSHTITITSGGSHAHTISTQANHTHSFSGTVNLSGATVSLSGVTASLASGVASLSSGVISNEGVSPSNRNMPPYMVVNKIIKL